MVTIGKYLYTDYPYLYDGNHGNVMLVIAVVVFAHDDPSSL